jgi:hypothetical protein
MSDFYPVLWLGAELPTQAQSLADFTDSFVRARLDQANTTDRLAFCDAMRAAGAPACDQDCSVLWTVPLEDGQALALRALVVCDEILLGVELNNGPEAVNAFTLVAWQAQLASLQRWAAAQQWHVRWVELQLESQLCELVELQGSTLQTVLTQRAKHSALQARYAHQRRTVLVALCAAFALGLTLATWTSTEGPAQGFLTAAIYLPLLFAVPLLLWAVVLKLRGR